MDLQKMELKYILVSLFCFGVIGVAVVKVLSPHQRDASVVTEIPMDGPPPVGAPAPVVTTTGSSSAPRSEVPPSTKESLSGASSPTGAAPENVTQLTKLMLEFRDGMKSEGGATQLMKKYLSCVQVAIGQSRTGLESTCEHNAQLLAAQFPSLQPQAKQVRKAAEANGIRMPTQFAPPAKR